MMSRFNLAIMLSFLFSFNIEMLAGEKSKLNGKSYVVERFLGEGREGRVYEVNQEDCAHKLIIKVFHNTSEARKNFLALVALNRTLKGCTLDDLGVVKIVGSDLDQNLLLLEFVAGTLGNELYDDESGKLSASTSSDDDSPSRFAGKYHRFQRWVNEQDKLVDLGIHLTTKNVLFTEDGRVIVFDPF
jgi:hypothetical protein